MEPIPKTIILKQSEVALPLDITRNWLKLEFDMYIPDVIKDQPQCMFYIDQGDEGKQSVSISLAYITGRASTLIIKLNDGSFEPQAKDKQNFTFLIQSNPTHGGLKIMEWNHIKICIGAEGLNQSHITQIDTVINEADMHVESIDQPRLDAGYFKSDIFNCFTMQIGSDHQGNSKFKGIFKNLVINQDISESSKYYSYVTNEERKLSEIDSHSYCDNYFHFFKNLYELYQFDPQDLSIQRATISYTPPAKEVSKRKVLICHDIPGGKNQDPICFDDFTQNFAYRFEHWSNVDGFIYFGHYRLTVPPPSWVNQAHRNGSKIFGTLIFEWDDGSKECKDMLDGVVTYKGKLIDDQLGELYYAEKIVEIAKFFKIDGYLMNFESDLKEGYVDRALQFLEYLKMRLKDEIGEHSELIWYDSVLATTGKVRWQSALRENNVAFFNVCDTFFTDYHWRPEFLDESLLFAGDRSWEVYYGNDVYGRGTYGGGVFNTHVALNEICQRPLSIAIFGQAYFYEQLDGWRNEHIFRRNEEKFWEGKQTVSFKLLNQSDGEMKVQNDGLITGVGKWHHLEGDFKLEVKKEVGEVIVSSFMWCKRVYELPLEQYKSQLGLAGGSFDNIEQIEFEVLIKGTPPNCADEYIVYVQAYDSQGNELADHNSNNSKANKIATNDWVLKKISINRNDLKSTNISKICVYESGKDVEYWAGHYGTQFANEKITISFNNSNGINSCNHIKKILGTRYIPSILPLSTNFNKSMGETVYFQGIKIKSNIKYNNLNNCDFNLSYNNYCVPINFKAEAKTNLASKMIIYDSDLSEFNCCQVFAYPSTKLAFNGTHCFEIAGYLAQKECTLIKLYKTHFESIENLNIRTVFKFINCSSNAKISLLFRDFEDNIFESQIKSTQEKEISKSEDEEWETNCDKLPCDLKNLRAIYVFVKNTSSSQINVQLFLGQFSLYADEYQNQSQVRQDTVSFYYKKDAKSEQSSLYDFYTIWLNWESRASSYRILRNEEWIGTTTLCQFIDKQVKVPKNTIEIVYAIQAIGKIFEAAEPTIVVVKLG